MLRTLLFIGTSFFTITLFFFALTAEAAFPTSGTPADQCIKASLRGEASTYNPYLPGYKGGSGILATGGPYNPNSYDAALQLNLARRYRCGYGRGAVCHAIVQAPNGRGMVVRINDNGPLNVPGRIIDLNTRSMDYLSGGSKGGSNGGTIKNVVVTLLCGIGNMALGPLDPKDREAWANRTFDTPYTNTGGYNGYNRSPFANVTPISYGSADSGYASGGANVPSGGTPYSSNEYYPQNDGSNSGNNISNYGNSYEHQYTAPVAQRDPHPSYQELLPDHAQPQPENVARIADIAIPLDAYIMVQPNQVSRGEHAIVSWTSLGMSQGDTCRVVVMQEGKEILVGQNYEGSRPLKIGFNSSVGTLTFTMHCISPSGIPIERTATLLVK